MDAVSARPERAGETLGILELCWGRAYRAVCLPGAVASERHGHGQKSQPQTRREPGIDILSSSLPLFFTTSHWPVGSQRAWTPEVSPTGHKEGQRRRKVGMGVGKVRVITQLALQLRSCPALEPKSTLAE